MRKPSSNENFKTGKFTRSEDRILKESLEKFAQDNYLDSTFEEALELICNSRRLKRYSWKTVIEILN